AGASTAYFLSRRDVDADVTVYEASGRIGGRVRFVEIADGEEKVKVEVGASIFGEIHRLHGLHRPWRTVAGALWRWGPLSTTRSRKLALEAGDLFGSNYALAEKEKLGFESVEGLLDALGIRELVGKEAWEFLRGKGIGEAYLREFVEAATRVNYGQNLDLNALAALVCLVAAFVPTEAVDMGNENIFKEMLRESGAQVLINRPVVEITKKATENGAVYLVKDGNGGQREFDVVVLGVPANKAIEGIKFTGIEKPPTIPFVHLYVTLVTGLLNPTYFAPHRSHRHPLFNSVAIKAVLSNNLTVTKIFSPTRMDDGLLAKMYKKVVDVKRIEWDSYPILSPRSGGEFGEGRGGVYYVNAMEAALSTMESETVAAMNVVQLLGRRWKEGGGKVKAKL
ncbi:Prenylcysteine lyase-domain-containing protein, partial [Chytridium lagenaria]